MSQGAGTERVGMTAKGKRITGPTTAETKTDLNPDAITEISNALRLLLADIFTLYLKTKNFHWHVTGRHFRDYHLLLDEQAGQLFEMTDEIAERTRKIGGTTVRSIGEVARKQRLKDNDDAVVPPRTMLKELCDDNVQLARYLRETHAICARHYDVATTSLIETWIDETERRSWFLTETISETYSLELS